MKIIITGSLGNVSRPLAKELVQKGHSVTVITSNPERQKAIEALGATAAIGALQNVDFLEATFSGSDAVYSMVPPPDFFNQNTDIMAHYRLIGNNYVRAIQKSGVKRLVHLSSMGAHLDKGTGLVLAHNLIESILKNLTDVAITFMRPTGFYTNLYSFIGGIKAMGAIASNYGAEDLIPWVSPNDIADAVAEEIVTLVTGKKVRYVVSEELICNDVAGILGAAIGKPDLNWIVIDNKKMQEILESVGIARQIAAGLVEMNASMHKGLFFDDYNLHKSPVLGKTKIKDFAKDFAGKYNQK